MGPNARIKIKLSLEDIYNGREMPVKEPLMSHLFRLLTIRCQSALTAEVLVQMILRMFTCASTVMVKVKSQKLRDWVLGSCNSSREPALIATDKERSCTQLAMYAEVISK